VPVQWPGLPLDVPRPPGASRSRPATLSDYLGQKVEVVGVLERVTGRDGIARYTLTIQKATK
jgi:hypothetical protein